MCALSNRIREKHDWWEKVNDETIVEKWREEALQQAGGDDNPVWNLTPGMVRPAYYLITDFSVTNLISPGQLCAPGATGIRRSARSGNWNRGMVRLQHPVLLTNTTLRDSRSVRENASGSPTNLSRVPCETDWSRLSLHSKTSPTPKRIGTLVLTVSSSTSYTRLCIRSFTGVR